MTCVNRKNLNELPQIFNLLVNLGVKRWRVSNVFPKGRAKDNPLFQLSNEEFRQVFEFIRETKTKKIINVNYDCEGFLGSYEKVVRDNPFFCWAGREYWRYCEGFSLHLRDERTKELAYCHVKRFEAAGV